MKKARLEKIYQEEIRGQLKNELGLKNPMEIPHLVKIVLNVGVKEAVSDSKSVQAVADIINRIAGQASVRTHAKKSIASFKIREGMPLGVKVTLRRQRMYEFLDKLVNIALPKVRDFQGVKARGDGRGSYNLGIKEWMIFPEVSYELSDKIYGMNITIQTSARNDAHAIELLRHFGMPFVNAKA